MSTAMTAARQHCDDVVVEADEPPDERSRCPLSPSQDSAFVKALPPRYARRESLLTRQLHASETDSHTEDEHRFAPLMTRGMSACSNPSVASTAELTSDNELTSPGTRTSTPSPPPPLARINTMASVVEKPLAEEPLIMGQDIHERSEQNSEKDVEAGLGRRRCITFACGKKPSAPKSTLPPPTEEEPEPAEPPKRKCALTFACPARTSAESAVNIQKPKPQRHFSPAPKSPVAVRSSSKSHRGSETTLKIESPKASRRGASLAHRRKYSQEVDDSALEARRFHEFGTDEKVEDEWVQESTCHRSRLTIKDTLHKENIIRQLGEEVEEEALEDDDEADDDDDVEALLDDDDDDEGGDEDEDDDAAQDSDEAVEDDEYAVSDAGFDTDDEEGFARSDDESDDSENEWWHPGRSTAATSTDHLEHIRPSHHRTSSDSSLESARDANGLPQKSQLKMKRKTQALKIHRQGTPELPDSTDFVCGTLDEDRPLEQAYLSQIESRKAAKRKVTPQDIDPTFPTSDPELGEEDEEGSEAEGDDVDESDAALFMHGNIDLNNEERTARRGRANSGSARKRSPHQSPRRLRSPPPPTQRAVLRSPPPPVKKHTHRSPPPEATRKHRAKSPAPPRRLFGTSPQRVGSPAPRIRLTSPRNSRRTSLEGTPSQAIAITASTLGQRPQPTHTASLPRVSTITNIRDARLAAEQDDAEDDAADMRTTRGAIDIVKGLEKKRQRRREKLYQKHCQKANKDREKKPKPGKGAERMREVGLELAAYKGKKEHMLSY